MLDSLVVAGLLLTGASARSNYTGGWNYTNTTINGTNGTNSTNGTNRTNATASGNGSTTTNSTLIPALSTQTTTVATTTSIEACEATFGNFSAAGNVTNCSYSLNGSEPIIVPNSSENAGNGTANTTNSTAIPFNVSAHNATAITGTRKVFVDNDGIVPLNVILPLLGGMDVVGVSGSFGDPTLADAVGAAADVLANYSLSQCIPLYAGAAQPFLRTKETYDVWEELYGEWVWKGAYADDYVESYNLTDVKYNTNVPAAMALIEAAKKYPGELEIYAGGLLTTVAQAVTLWPDFVKNVKALWIMGGYIDFQYAQATGTSTTYDVNTDFNLMLDPEAADIVLTAGFENVFIGGNVTNYVYPPQSLFNKLIKDFTAEQIETNPALFAISSFIGNGNASDVTLPLWDEAVSAFMAFPEVIESTTDVAVAVDTAFDSPFYGNLRVWPEYLKPKRGRWGNATYVDTINEEAVFEKIYSALILNWTTYCGNTTTVYPLSTNATAKSY